MITTVRLAEPRVEGQRVTFSWSVEPTTTLYERTHFSVDFPSDLDPAGVPTALWWRFVITCLHVHWVLLRPCRVVLPVTLADGEREVWLRMCDAVVAGLEAHALGTDLARTIELVEAGPPSLAPDRPEPLHDDLVVACFSGGRDSSTQAALLQELGRTPLLVTTTSARIGSVEHATPRRAHVLAEFARRRRLAHIDVQSDFRTAVDNMFVAERYRVAVSEINDCMLYLATAAAAAWMRGAPSVFLASENEVQTAGRWHGTIAQRWTMYSMSTQRSLSAPFAPFGVRFGGLTASLRQFQVQRLLADRYRDVRDLQYSCWELGADEAACSWCGECRGIALNLMVDGVSPAEIGVDVATMLGALAGWRPGESIEVRTAWRRARAATVADPQQLAGDRNTMATEARILYCLSLLEPDRVAEFLPPGEGNGELLAAYARHRDDLLADRDIEPEPGYRAAWLELVDEALRPGLRQIYDEHFDPRPVELDRADVRQALTLSRWITAPMDALAAPAERPAPPVATPTARPPSPSPLDDVELAAVGENLPGPEPSLVTPHGERVLPVADTALDGNERRYVQQCLDANRVSSMGPFVSRFEEAFATAVGCAHAVACSSGTTALHLALAAAGIGPGDEVIIPTFTMIATANVVGYVGATPVFVDTDPATWNLDLQLATQAVGRRTRAIVVVHTYGQPIDPRPWRDLARRNGLVLIEDAAQAHGADARGEPVGSLGRAAAFSFYGNKILTTGEGGMVTTNDAEVAAVARELRDHGFSPVRHFWHRLRAFNYRMGNLQAAVGLAQVERLDELVAKRRITAQRYADALSAVPGLTLPPVVEGLPSVHWMYGVLVGPGLGCTRDELRQRLAAEGIETRTFFVPLHLQPAYVRQHAGRHHPVAERLGRTGLYLPSGPSITEPDVARVAAAIERAGQGSRTSRPSSR